MPGDRFFSLQEICVLLNIAPRTFRQLFEDYADLLNWQPAEGADLTQGLPAAAFDRLRTIVELRNKGEDEAGIRRALSSAPSATAAASLRLPVADDSDVAESVVVALLRDLGEQLQAARDQWVEEREKILTSLIRVQQELQSLRYEVASQASRRARKRKGLWGRIAGD
jgi:hypothetical protein